MLQCVFPVIDLDHTVPQQQILTISLNNTDKINTSSLTNFTPSILLPSPLPLIIYCKIYAQLHCYDVESCVKYITLCCYFVVIYSFSLGTLIQVEINEHERSLSMWRKNAETVISDCTKKSTPGKKDWDFMIIELKMIWFSNVIKIP